MRAYMVSLCIGLALAAPQGYNYQIDIGLGDISSIQEVPNQYEALQQYSPQTQPQQQQPQIDQIAGQLPQIAQAFTLDQGGLQFSNQLPQNGQQAIQLQQLPAVQQQQFQQLIIPPAQVVEPPREQFVAISDQPKPIEFLESQPEFIIKHRSQPQAEQIPITSSGQKTVVFQKEFYYLSAPQEENETTKELDDQLNTIKKNLRVVFIKAPENNGLEKAVLQLAKQSVNSQTAIYVLTKQHDPSELAKKLQSIKSSNSQRPEVIFIKYRTPEEAEHAQRVVQAQFEALSGPNHINRPNTAVTHDFVGSTVISGGDPRKSRADIGAVADTGGKPEKVRNFKPAPKHFTAFAKH